MASSLNGTGVTFSDATTQSTAAVVNTTTVLSATAGATAGAVGTYAFLKTETASIGFGTTLAGSSLLPLGILELCGTANFLYGGSAQAGTWRCMGYLVFGGAGRRGTLFLRIS